MRHLCYNKAIKEREVTTMKGIITKETEKYIYTTEIIKSKEIKWFVTFTTGHCCTVFSSEEEAKANGDRLAKLFGHDSWGVKSYTDEVTTIKHHRYTK
jgi:mevalonate pyrophosphate decarboxylase